MKKERKSLDVDNENEDELTEKRYCKICGSELQDNELDICLNCQSAIISSGTT